MAKRKRSIAPLKGGLKPRPQQKKVVVASQKSKTTPAPKFAHSSAATKQPRKSTAVQKTRTSLSSLPKVRDHGPSTKQQKKPSQSTPTDDTLTPQKRKKLKKKPEIRVVNGFVMTIVDSEDEDECEDEKSDEEEELDTKVGGCVRCVRAGLRVRDTTAHAPFATQLGRLHSFHVCFCGRCLLAVLTCASV
jgi:hypothetical protein